MSTEDVTSSSGRTHENLLASGHKQLRELIHGSMSAEFAAGRNGKPVTFPLTPFFDDEGGSIVVTSPVAYAGKAKAVERDPRVSMLLHDADGEYLVTGDAEVHYDVSTNTARVRELNDREPPTPKRTANEEKYRFAESRLGSLLVGWLGQRIVIEIDPVSMIRIADASSIEELSAWPAAGIDRAESGRYERATLSVVDEDGYPATRPVEKLRVGDDGSAVVEPGPPVPVRDGQPACLLLHWHDDASIKLAQRVIRGRFWGDRGSLRFVPAGSSTLRNDGYLDTLRFIVDGKRRTRAYFRERDASTGTESNGGSMKSTANGGSTQTPTNDDSEQTATNGGATPPGPTALPLIGNTHQFVRDPFRFYEALPSYGDVVRYRVGWQTWTAILHPDAVERVLVGESQRFRRYNFEDLGFDLPAEGLFFTDGEQWRRQRKVIQPAFAPAKIAPFADTIVSQTLETVDRWDDGETIATNHAFSELVLEILTTTLFDLDLDERRDVVTAAGRALSDRADTQSLSAFLPAWVPTARNRRFTQQMARFDEMVEELIAERRNEDADRNDLLSTLLELTVSEQDIPSGGSDRSAGNGDATGIDTSFTDEELRDQLVTFLFAGHETTALVLTYAFLLTSQHDEVRQTLDEELATVCGDRDPTIEDVPALEFTEKVIKETMRYYPPVYVLFREAREDVTVDGYLIPNGTKLALPQYILHSDDRWWDDPREFRPDRWTDELEAEMANYAYFPFGGGPRHCVGMRLAMMILTLGFATIARRVHFDLESEPDPDLRMAATLAPASDVKLTVRKRM